VAFSIDQSDAVTAVSESLRRDTVAALGIKRAIEVIPNFLDCNVYQRRVDPDLRAPDRAPTANWCHARLEFPPGQARRHGARRLPARAIARQRPAGDDRDGPDRGFLEVRVREEGLSDVVTFTGEQPDPVAWLSAGDVFLLPLVAGKFWVGGAGSDGVRDAGGRVTRRRSA
jgi:glycosyltransferase involved in cell wall biosynthesis